MYNKQVAQSYTNAQINTIDRGRLLLMMFDGGLNFLKHAKEGLENKDISKFCRFLSKGQAIIAELMNTLDFEKGGKIARDLHSLYDFMLFYLIEANIQKNPAKVAKVIDLLETIAGAFREIIEGNEDKLQSLVDEASRSAKSAAAGEGMERRSISVSF